MDSRRVLLKTYVFGIRYPPCNQGLMIICNNDAVNTSTGSGVDDSGDVSVDLQQFGIFTFQ